MSVARATRRSVLGGAAAVAIGIGANACKRLGLGSEAPPPASVSDAGRGEVDVLDWTFERDGGVAATAASILVPKGAPASQAEKFPVLVALHGRGEARKSPKRGARGWPDDYALTRTIARAAAPPLMHEDYEGFVRGEDLAQTNEDLIKRPYAGLIIACPYVPDLDLQSDKAIATFGTWILEVLLPRVHAETPALTTAKATGIDGVSLGGAISLHVGLAHPETFGAVGTLQPAIDSSEADSWTARAKAARAANPDLHLRLTTSELDPFRHATVTTSDAWKAAGISHDVEVLLGPHDYPFNRGPGGFAMLLWHDRMLRS